MVKVPRGGDRKGQAGKAYSNRSDLRNAVNQAPAKVNPMAQRAAQAQASQAPQQPSQVPNVRPELSASDVPSLFAPDEHPQMPITAGLPGGAGPGPEVMQSGLGPEDPAVADLRAVFQMYPYEGIRRLLDGYR